MAPIIDDVPIDQRQNDSSAVLFQKAGNVVDGKQMIDEQIADSQSPFGIGIEIQVIFRQGKRSLIHLKPISSFVSGLFRLGMPTELKEPESQGCLLKISKRALQKRPSVIHKNHWYP